MRYRSTLFSWLLACASVSPLWSSQAMAQSTVDTVNDAEQQLADQSKAERTFTFQLNRIAKTSPDDPSRLRVYNELMTRFPDSDGTARLRVGQITPLGEQGKWSDYVEQSAQWLAQYPQWSQHQHNLLYDMARRLHQKDVPDEVKFEIFNTMVPHLAHRLWLGTYTRNYISRLDKTPLEKYGLAQQVAVATGPGDRVRVMLWSFITTIQTTNPDIARLACHELSTQYGLDHLETKQAQLFLFAQYTGDDEKWSKESKAQQQQYKQATADLKTNFASTLVTLETSDAPLALASFNKLLADTPAYLHQTLWQQLGQKFGQLSQETRIAIMMDQAGELPDSQIAETIRTWALRDLLSDAKHYPTLLAVQAQCNDDAGRSLNMWSYTLKTLANLKASPTTLSHAYAMAADTATKLGAQDVAAEYLFESARTGWDTDLPHAIAQLQQAAATRHWLAAGAKANWFLAYLQDQNKLVQPVSPRDYNPANHVNRLLPKLTLPEAAALPSVVKTTVKKNDQWTLAAQDVKQNLLANQTPIASSDQDNAKNAIDQNNQTAWQPTALPAVLVIPLSQQASVNCIELELASPTHLVFTLLDNQGKALARFERDWSFWDQYKTDNMWAQGKLTLNLPVVDNVSFVRVEVYGSMGQASVNQLAIFPAAHRSTGWVISEPIKLNSDARAVTLHSIAIEPTLDVTRDANNEAARGYPIYRWGSPWTQKKGEVILRSGGGHLAHVFDGTNVTLTLQRTGGVDWQIDDGPIQHIDQTEPDKKDYLLATNLSSGKHILRLINRALPAKNDQWGSNNIRVVSITTHAKAIARLAVRFSEDGKTWSGWYTQPHDKQNDKQDVQHDDSQNKTAATAQVNNKTLTLAFPDLHVHYQFNYAQAGVLLDAAPTQGKIVPVLKSLSLEQSTEENHPDAGYTKDKFEADILADISLVASLLAQRKVVVVYPKIGSQKTYELAKSIADIANVYLVSDDIALNDYPGLVLAVGTPLEHRYTRQLIASHGLWLDAHYLNNTCGSVFHTLDANNQPKTAYLTGESHEAIAAAAERLLNHLKSYRRIEAQKQAAETATTAVDAQSPIALFPASTLEMVYPWQLHTDRSPLKQVDLRMAQNDRRSVQFGMSTHKTLTNLKLATSDLTTSDGQTIPASQINLRVAGSYEWIPFFGDLRLPNILTPEPVVPMPANAALGIWLTVTSNANTKPGVYQGTLSITANEHTSKLPVSILVEPIALTATTKTATYSFANVPYWFTPGTDAWRNAAKSLAANEADHGANYVAIGFEMNWQPATNMVPREYRIAKRGTEKAGDKSAADESWHVGKSAMVVKPQEALEIRFSQPIAPWAVAVGFNQDNVKKIKLQVLDEQSNWQDVSELSQAVGAGDGVGNGLQAPIVFETREAISGTFTTYRLTFESSLPVSIQKITAFTDRKQTQLFTCDFSGMIEQMAIADAQYKARSLPLPGFIAQVGSESHRISQLLLGVYTSHENICTLTMSRQLLAAIKAHGAADRFLLKVGDEPRDIAKWSEAARPYREVGLRTMTCHGVHYPDMSVAIDLINPWVPNYQHNINLPFLRERQKLGEPLWWYECGVPATRMTGSPIENLPFYWLTAKWHLDGAMNYAAMHTSDFSMPVPFRYEHGLDHRIVFEADGSVLDTTRRELENDGIRDLKVIEYIRQRCKVLAPQNAQNIEAKLEALLEKIVPYKYGYSMDPAAWEAARNTLYDLAKACEQ